MSSRFADCVGKRCREESSIEGTEIKNLAVLTIAFQLVFTGFYALQNLHSSLHDEESLGLVCLSVLYGTGIMSSVLAPTIIGVFGVKSVLVTAFAAHSIYVVANFYPTWATMIPAAVFLGALYGPSWTSQGVYLSACSFSYSKTSSSSPFAVLSRFNGFFFAVIATTQIVGNVMTSLVIRDGVGNKSEVIVFKYCGPNDCPENENATMIEDPEDWVIDLTLFVFLALSVCGLLLTFFVLTPLPRSEWVSRVSPREMAGSCVHVLVTTNMPLLIPFIIFTGMEHAFLLGSFTKSYISCPIGIHMVGFVMSAYGITTPCFVYIFSKLVRVTGRFLLIMTSSVIHLGVLVFILHWEPTDDDMVIIFFVPILWGMAESIQQAQTNALIALLYPNQKESAFANFHAWRSLGYCVTFLNVAYMCVEVKIIVCIVCLVTGAGLYTFVEIQTKVREKSDLRAAVKEEKEDVVDGQEESYKHTTPVQCTQIERLSFEHYALADIIKDAEVCWQRDGNGNMVLEVEKVMSQEHLKESKVTSLFHTRLLPEMLDSLKKQQERQSLSRSKSDTHLSSSDYRLRRHRNERDAVAVGRNRPASAQIEDLSSHGVLYGYYQDGVILEDEECVYDNIVDVSFDRDDEDSLSLEFVNNNSPIGRGFYDADDGGNEMITIAVDNQRSYDARFSKSSGGDEVCQIGEQQNTGVGGDGNPRTNKNGPSSKSKNEPPDHNNIINKMNKKLNKKQSKRKSSTRKESGNVNNAFVHDERDITKQIQTKSREETGKLDHSQEQGLMKRRRQNKSLHLRIDNKNDGHSRRTSVSTGKTITLPVLNVVELERYKQYNVSNLVQNYGLSPDQLSIISDADSDGFVSDIEDDKPEVSQYSLSVMTPGKEDSISIY